MPPAGTSGICFAFSVACPTALDQPSTNGGYVRSMWFALSSGSVMHAFALSVISKLGHDAGETTLGLILRLDQQSTLVVDSAAQTDHILAYPESK